MTKPSLDVNTLKLSCRRRSAATLSITRAADLLFFSQFLALLFFFPSFWPRLLCKYQCRQTHKLWVMSSDVSAHRGNQSSADEQTFKTNLHPAPSLAASEQTAPALCGLPSTPTARWERPPGSGRAERLAGTRAGPLVRTARPLCCQDGTAGEADNLRRVCLPNALPAERLEEATEPRGQDYVTYQHVKRRQVWFHQEANLFIQDQHWMKYAVCFSEFSWAKWILENWKKLLLKLNFIKHFSCLACVLIKWSSYILNSVYSKSELSISSIYCTRLTFSLIQRDSCSC